MCIGRLLKGKARIEGTTPTLPDFGLGGGQITFTIKGAVPKEAYLNPGNGSKIQVEEGMRIAHLITKAGAHRATLFTKSGRIIGRYDYELKHNSPVVKRPFVIGPIMLLQGVIIDTRPQVHGCAGGGGEEEFGIWLRPHEKVSVRITALNGSVKVWGDLDGPGQAKWYIGHENPPPIPADMDVLGPNGMWHPGDPVGVPQSSCEENQKHAANVIVQVTNQIGSTTTLTMPLVWQAEGQAAQVVLPCRSTCSQ